RAALLDLHCSLNGMCVIRVEILLPASVHAPRRWVDPLLDGGVRNLLDKDAYLHSQTPWGLGGTILPVSLTDESISGSGGGRPANEINDLLGRGTRCEDLGDAQFSQLGNVLGGNRSAYCHDHIVYALLAQQRNHTRNQSHVRTGEDRQTDSVGVLLDN